MSIFNSTPLMSVGELLPDIEINFKIHKGKVRESVDLGENLLMVATDRISTFDFVHPNGISGKGRILTQMTLRWLDLLGSVVPNHLITAKIEEFPEPFNNKEALRGRSILVRKLRMIPIEFIARGYITGSALAEYRRTGAVSGIELPSGLVESQKLEEPIFTPSTKATVGHDEKERLFLGDEVITPGSSRFWDAALYQPGRPQDSLDKQYVRDYGRSIGWNRQPPAPFLPPEVVSRTSQKYAEAHKRLFG